MHLTGDATAAAAAAAAAACCLLLDASCCYRCRDGLEQLRAIFARAAFRRSLLGGGWDRGRQEETKERGEGRGKVSGGWGVEIAGGSSLENLHAMVPDVRNHDVPVAVDGNAATWEVE